MGVDDSWQYSKCLTDYVLMEIFNQAENDKGTAFEKLKKSNYVYDIERNVIEFLDYRVC